MSEWVSEWVSVSEGAGGGGRRKADTELKTKTPHVNVGKNSAKLISSHVRHQRVGADSGPDQIKSTIMAL